MRLDVKPWSAPDEFEELDAAAAPSASRLAALGDAHVALPRRPVWAGRTVRMALVALPLFATLCVTGWTAAQAGRVSSGQLRWRMAGLALLVATAGGTLLTARRRGQSAVAAASGGQATHADGGPNASDAEAELRPIINAITQQLADAQEELGRIRSAHEQDLLERHVLDGQRRQIEAVVESLSEAIIVTDECDRVMLCNAIAESALQINRASATRKPVAEVLNDEALARLVRQCREAGESGVRRHFELPREAHTFDLTLAPVNLRSGDPKGSTAAWGVVIMLRDVTREKEVSKAKSDFVAKVAHELRTPLSSIRAYVELLVDGEATDARTQREYYEIIQTSTERLGRLIDNMLNISRIEAGTVRVNKEPISVAVLMKEAADVARPQADAKQIKLEVELTPVFYQVLGDRDLISQAILNLLSNAIKYTPEGGSVRVRMCVSEEPKQVTIAVRDSGVGIPQEDLPKVFQKFFRVAANSKMAKGTGLGLNLVKHIVEGVHGGKVAVASKVGEGSTFTIELPLHE